jgi:hypothetical protein
MSSSPPDRIPPDSDLYIPKKASSTVWRAFRLSYSDPNRAWCSVCHVWLTVSFVADEGEAVA